MSLKIPAGEVGIIQPAAGKVVAINLPVDPIALHRERPRSRSPARPRRHRRISLTVTLFRAIATRRRRHARAGREPLIGDLYRAAHARLRNHHLAPADNHLVQQASAVDVQAQDEVALRRQPSSPAGWRHPGQWRGRGVSRLVSKHRPAWTCLPAFSASATRVTGPRSPDSSSGASFVNGFHVVEVSRCCRRKRLVADQPVRPEVRHGDLQLVTLRLDRAGNLHPPGRAPDHPQVPPVESHPRQVLHHSQVQKQPLPARNLRRVEGFAIDGSAGIIPDPILRSLGPVHERVEGDALRAAPLRVERHFPRAGQLGQPCAGSCGKFRLPRPLLPRASRNTTKNDCAASKRRGTVVRPSREANSGNARICPVSGSHSSGALPDTRNVQLASTGRSSRLATK